MLAVFFLSLINDFGQTECIYLLTSDWFADLKNIRYHGCHENVTAGAWQKSEKERSEAELKITALVTPVIASRALCNYAPTSLRTSSWHFIHGCPFVLWKCAVLCFRTLHASFLPAGSSRPFPALCFSLLKLGARPAAKECVVPLLRKRGAGCAGWDSFLLEAQTRWNQSVLQTRVKSNDTSFRRKEIPPVATQLNATPLAAWVAKCQIIPVQNVAGPEKQDISSPSELAASFILLERVTKAKSQGESPLPQDETAK